MKKILLIALAFVPLLSMAQDDIYFTPKKKTAKTSATRRVDSSDDYSRAADATVTDLSGNKAVAVAPKLEVYNNNSRTEDDYNRRYTYNKTYDGTTNSGDWQDGGGKDSLAASVDSIKTKPGYSHQMDDAEDDYYYSRRLLRFHSPRLVVVRSPYYWDLVYGCGCYDYYDYWYDDPFFWDWGWGCGWSWGPWSCWYGPMWGWCHPRGWDYWGWGPSWRPWVPWGPGPGFVGPGGWGPGMGPGWGAGITGRYAGSRSMGLRFERGGIPGTMRSNSFAAMNSRSSGFGGGSRTSRSGFGDMGSRSSRFSSINGSRSSMLAQGSRSGFGGSRSGYAGSRATSYGNRGGYDGGSRSGLNGGSRSGYNGGSRSAYNGGSRSGYEGSRSAYNGGSRSAYNGGARSSYEGSRSTSNTTSSSRSGSFNGGSRSTGSYGGGSFSGGSRSGSVGGGSFGGGSRGGFGGGGGGSRGGGGFGGGGGGRR